MAVWAEVAGATGNLKTFNRRFADFAGLAFALVNIGKLQVVAATAIGLDVVLTGSTTVFQRKLENLGNTLIDFFNFRWF